MNPGLLAGDCFFDDFGGIQCVVSMIGWDRWGFN